MKDSTPKTGPSELSLVPTGTLPPILVNAGPKGSERFRDFFTSTIRNANTRAAYLRATRSFFNWLQKNHITDFSAVKPVHVAAYIEELQTIRSKPTVKQHLAAIRMLFDWLVIGHVMDTNPAHSVRAPRYSTKKGKTPILSSGETRELLDSIDTSNVVGLRNRALIALMTFTFARVGAVVTMRVEDYYQQGRRWWVRLHEKGGKLHTMPCHHNLETYLAEYIEAAGIVDQPKTPLFRSVIGKTTKLTDRLMARQDVFRMIQRRALDAGIGTKVGCHTFRGTGITSYLKNGGKREVAQQMANHESARTTQLYDRRGDEISLDEVEKIGI
ncbi:MAG TPA: tyrosine-type recombinase/integrase [Pyrinomonadaceae bacterium]|nr:tyrosine-type recombinase/integrase [Pyrinomonadaceae bacterium]